MIVSISDEVASSKSRLIAIRLASLTLRCMENWRRVAGGYDEAMIILGVVAVTADRLLRTDLPTAAMNLENPFPVQDLARCNIASISVATGLNRETVRRKVDTMITAGFFVKSDDGGINFSPGVLQSEEMVSLIRTQLDSFRYLAESLVNEGVFRLGPSLNDQPRA